MSYEISFGHVVVSESGPVVIIAEAACEHLGSIEVAKRMADAAKHAGADIIKFQFHLPDEMLPGASSSGAAAWTMCSHATTSPLRPMWN